MKINRLLLVSWVMVLCACAAVQLHPGAVNKADSSAYDVLLISQAVIDQSRVELAAGTLPETLKAPLNHLIESHNIARASWLAYRNAVKAGQTTDAGKMKSAIDILSAALDAFESSRSIQ